MDTSEKSDETNDFYLILSSNSSLNFHQNNNASCFITELPKRLDLKGNWEVALHEFAFTFSPYQLLSNSTIRYIRHSEATIKRTIRMNNNEVEMKEKDGIVTIANINQPKPCVVFSIESDRGGDKGFFLKFQNISDANAFGFTKLRNRTTSSKLVGDNKPLSNTDYINVRVMYNPFVSDKITFKEHFEFSTLKDLEKYMMEIGSHVFLTCKFTEKGYFQFTIKTEIKSLSFDASLVTCLGLNKETYEFDSDVFEGEQVHEGEKKVSVTHTYHNMLIYCNIVSPITVGDSRVPLLKSLWFDKYEPDELVKVIIKRPMYLKTSRSVYDNIEINIRDDEGEFIKFASKTHTEITLHFRPEQSE